MMSLRPLVSISSTFDALFLRQYFCIKKLQSQIVTGEKLCEALFYEKFASKMLIKLTPVELILPNFFFSFFSSALS